MTSPQINIISIDSNTTVELILSSCINNTPIYCFRLTYPRIVHPEVLRHRSFSYASSSSRAIKFLRLVSQFMTFIPTKWRRHKPGMQPDEKYEYSSFAIFLLNTFYKIMAFTVKCFSMVFYLFGISKEQINRWIEPYSVIVHLMQGTYDDFQSFIKLRHHQTAQYEIRQIASGIKDLILLNIPPKRLIHLPFIENYNLPIKNSEIINLLDTSAALCARVSYFDFEGKVPSKESNKKLFNSLKKDNHFSPFEFQIIDYNFGKSLFKEQYKLREEDFRELLDHKYIEKISYKNQGKKIDFSNKNNLRIFIRKNLSGNLNSMEIIQYRKIIEITTKYLGKNNG
jgi:hypothetical protein